MDPDINFFKSPDVFRRWLSRHYNVKTELWLGFYKVKSGKKGITYKEAVDQALCFGWIDGVRKNIDAVSYKIRFTPRKPGSIWSLVNIAKVKELTESGLIQPSGIAAFSRRSEKRSGIYSFEKKDYTMDPDYEKEFKSNRKAWDYYANEAPWYRHVTTHWVMSAKQEETRLKRLGKLITDSAKGRRMEMFTKYSSKK